MHFSFLPALSIVLILGGSSCNHAADQPTTPPVEPGTHHTATSPPATLQQPRPESPVSLAGHTFRLKSFPLDQTTGEAPQVSIYLYPNQQPDSVLVGVDTQPSVLDADQGTRLGVPKAAVLLFQTYYAGAGYHYYALVKGNQLRVYRRRLEEGTPETEHSARPSWELLKTFGFFTNGARQLRP